MKRFALMIGNMEDPAGVKKDLEAYYDFFMSDIGGAWYENELKLLNDPEKKEVLGWVENLKNSKLDYCIVIFSGHGGTVRNQTELEINSNKEKIFESELKGIATKWQVNIFDCCRSFPKRSERITEMEKGIASFSSLDNLSYIEIVRKMYEERIAKSARQQLSLYACRVGQTAYGESITGGYYSQYLIDSAKKISGNFQTFNQCHEYALESCKNDYRTDQIPDFSLQKYSDGLELIMSINPNRALVEEYVKMTL